MNGIQIWMGISASQSKVYIVLKFKKWIWMEMAKYPSMNLMWILIICNLLLTLYEKIFYKIGIVLVCYFNCNKKKQYCDIL